jgi:hypothetical protein
MKTPRAVRFMVSSLVLCAFVLGNPGHEALAQSPSKGEQEYLRELWDSQENWTDQGPSKAIRATAQNGRWEVLVSFGEQDEWHHQGFLDEISRSPLVAGEGLNSSLRASFETFRPDLFVGEARSSRGQPAYVVAVLFGEAATNSDASGRLLTPLVPVYVADSRSGAETFAEQYRLSVVSSGAPQEEPSPGEPLPNLTACETICFSQYTSSINQCNLTYAACTSTVNAAFLLCAEGCGGIPACEAVCLAASLLGLAHCVLAMNSCDSTASQVRDLCLAHCDNPGPGCGAVVTQTATIALSLGEATAGGLDLTRASVTFPLARSETRGDDTVLVDEWAVTESGEVTASSNPAFAQAVTEQGAAPPVGRYLVVQEPIHADNSRKIPKPDVRISSTGLSPDDRGTGQTVAARLELSNTGIVDRAQILYTSEPMDEARLEELVRHRIGLAFASEKRHRTVVFVVFRLTDRFELLGTYTVLPQCCCGDHFCV